MQQIRKEISTTNFSSLWDPKLTKMLLPARGAPSKSEVPEVYRGWLRLETLDHDIAILKEREKWYGLTVSYNNGIQAQAASFSDLVSSYYSQTASVQLYGDGTVSRSQVQYQADRNARADTIYSIGRGSWAQSVQIHISL